MHTCMSPNSACVLVYMFISRLLHMLVTAGQYSVLKDFNVVDNGQHVGQLLDSYGFSAVVGLLCN